MHKEIGSLDMSLEPDEALSAFNKAYEVNGVERRQNKKTG